MLELDVAILGAGSAGLSARSLVSRKTQNYRIFDGGPLGTTCARVGCMPSKALIQVAHDFHSRKNFLAQGITGAEHLSLESELAMNHVRALRDRFVRSVEKSMHRWKDTHLVPASARFTSQSTLRAGEREYSAKRIIIATGSTPIVPEVWRPVRHLLSTSDDVFEWKTLPKSLAVIGMGVIGVELGQAFSRLGVAVQAISLDRAAGGLTDPNIQNYAIETLSQEFPLDTSGVKGMSERNGQLVIRTEKDEYEVEHALVAIGRRPNLSHLGLESLSLEMDKHGVPLFDEQTYRIPGTGISIAGDANGTRQLLHEASDEGWIVGFNASQDEDDCFARRVPLSITFSDPQIALVGQSHKHLLQSGRDFVTGSVSFEGYGRAIIMMQEKGLLHIYADRQSGLLLGAEMFAPGAEHLAHLLAWALSTHQDVNTALTLPFYHPVLEEGLKSALRDARSQLSQPPPPIELVRCQDVPVNEA